MTDNLLRKGFIAENRSNFELFKSNVCHRVKELGDIDFIIDTLENDNVSKYYKAKWYPESFYVLAMLDYLCRINNIPLCDEYSIMRRQKLDKIIYPASIIALSYVSNDEGIKLQSIDDSIPEFIRFNIVESEIRDIE